MSIYIPRGEHGTAPEESSAPMAQWATGDMVAAHPDWTQGQGTFIGVWDDTIITRVDDRHHLLVAGSRSGKGRSILIPTLVWHQGSALVVDPKGELATITARHRGPGNDNHEGDGQDVFVLDPFNVVRGPAQALRARFNPLLELDPESLTLVDDTDLIADALILPEDRDPHWSLSARAFLKGVVLYVTLNEAPENRTLSRVLELINLSMVETDEEESDFGRLLGDMDALSSTNPAAAVVQAEARALESMSEKERSSVLSTLRRNLKFIQSPAMSANMKASDFSLADLKRNPKGMTVYLCLPASHMRTHSPWLRVLVDLGLVALEREQIRPDIPVLFMLEEFATLGHMKSIENAAGQIAGFGVKLYVVLQDLGQLKALYRDRWETFLANCGVVQAFGNSDLTTLEYLSKRLGQTVVSVESRGQVTHTAEMQGMSGVSLAAQLFPLMTPDEIATFFAREQMNQLVLVSGKSPLILARFNYDQNQEWADRVDPDPNYASTRAGDETDDDGEGDSP